MTSAPELAERAIYRADAASLEGLLESGLDPNSTDEDGRTLLMISILASEASNSIVSLLVQAGANVNAVDEGQKWTPLHFASRDHRADIALTLLDAGANIDATDIFGNTPLWRAVATFRGDLKTIDLLLQRGADPKKQNRRGVSAIDLASKPELVERLRRMSADA